MKLLSDIYGYHYDNYGRISKLSTANTNISYVYNSNNQIIEKKQTANQQTLITRYAYTNGGKQTQIRLPSGKLIEYHHNTGILQSISVKHDDKNSEIINNLTYNPNGITGYTWGQTNQPVSYDYDLDGRLTNIRDNALNRSYNYDVGNRITDIIDNQGRLTLNYQHDRLDRLINQSLNVDNANQALSYVYDRNSNRTQKTEQGNQVTTPVEATSNKYTDYTYDKSGRTLNDGIRQYEYNNAGRISRVVNGANGGSYGYNGLGQRVKKTANGETIYFNYDESGQLIGEYNSKGKVIREYIYLGNQPIAMLSNERDDEVLQIHTDHLGTPRAVTDKNKSVLWKMEGDQFGDVQPQIVEIKMPLRHAGQYADDESGLFYNYFRYYNPATGRYLRSDPIGLEGGLNTFGYVGSNPLHKIDPRGLIEWDAYYGEAGGGLVFFGGKIVHFVFKATCENNKGIEREATVNVMSTGIGLSTGIDPSISLGAGRANFKDNNNTVDPQIFNGVFLYGGVSWLFSGTLALPVQVGGATGNMNTKWGKGIHTDLVSLELVAGVSIVVGEPKWRKYCECSN